MPYIYVLKCAHNKYYVGKTNYDVLKRFREHMNEQGSGWTSIHKPIEILEVFEGDKFDEDKYTKMYMEKFGIDNVRGGSYTAMHLSKDMKEHIQNEFTACNDKCFTCNKKGHFARDCPNEYLIQQRIVDKLSSEGRCFACGRKGHYADSCYAKTYDNSLTDHEIKILAKIHEDSESDCST